MKIFVVSVAVLFSAATLPAQTVQAHYAQALLTISFSAHPELQKMGLHVTPPGTQDELIVACSVPSKIGKKSSAPDLATEQSGKPSVKTVAEESFYDLALPLNDASAHHIGMIVMEMRFSGASGPDDAVQKAQAITNDMEKQIPSLQSLFTDAPHEAPLVLISTTKLPGITGDFDHFAANQKDNKLYLSAEVHHSIEVFDLKTGEHLQSAPTVSTPHTLAYDPEVNQLFVADGGDSSCRILDGGDLHEVKRVPLEAGPDAGFYDAQEHIFYVGNGGREAKQPFSFITAISTRDGSVLKRIRVESANLEAMSINRSQNLLYVNMRDKKMVGVVDLKSGVVRQTWVIPDLNLNTPMSFDAKNNRLFVAGRKPGKFYVIDTQSGRVVKTLDCIDIADDMSFDSEQHRIYVTGSTGVSVYKQNSADDYTLLAQFGTNGGKTSALDAKAHRLYIAHTKTPEDNAALQSYAIQ